MRRIGIYHVVRLESSPVFDWTSAQIGEHLAFVACAVLVAGKVKPSSPVTPTEGGGRGSSAPLLDDSKHIKQMNDCQSHISRR